eukprot:848551-Pelagomonas_calceolata.AAC.2
MATWSRKGLKHTWKARDQNCDSAKKTVGPKTLGLGLCVSQRQPGQDSVLGIHVQTNRPACSERAGNCQEIATGEAAIQPLSASKGPRPASSHFLHAPLQPDLRITSLFPQWGRIGGPTLAGTGENPFPAI